MENKNKTMPIGDNLRKPDVVLFVFQIIIIFIVVCVCLVNLSFQWGNQNLWTVVLTGSLGYIMPNPRLKLSNTSAEAVEIKSTKL
jgi:hypothetical protein